MGPNDGGREDGDYAPYDVATAFHAWCFILK
jgi:hypothetical protein